MNRLQYYVPLRCMQKLFEIFLYATNNLRDILSHIIT